MVEQFLHHSCGGWPDSVGLEQRTLPAQDQACHLLTRQMIELRLALARHLGGPGAELGVELAQRLRVAAGEELAGDVVDPSLFHLSLVLRRPRPGWIDEEAIVLRTLPVRPLGQRLAAEARPHNRRL